MRPVEDIKLFYRSEWSFGGFLHSNGFGGTIRYGQHLTGSKKRIWNVDILNLRHQKEKRITNSPDALAFRYGKINTLTNLRLGLGRQNVIFGKELKKGVEISYNYVVGLSVGFLKPVYLEVVGSDGAGSREIERYDPDVHFKASILGRASFVHGLSEIELVPGGHAKFAFNFEFEPEDDRLKMIEAGAAVDVFYKETELLYNANNHQVWVTFYAAYIFGKKKR
ncbi:MAG TPA: hypothetical protein DDX92_08840 [Flavobacteriales bacterium]|jgi:hypothetical protein|nr:hypothetical protein [Flavobacteriales bacterium]